MGILAAVADCHLGNFRAFGGLWEGGLNYRCRLTVETLRQALLLAHGSNADLFVIAGDLFETKRPEPPVLAAAQRAFAEVDGEMAITILPGNHDMPSATAAGGDTACEPMHVFAAVLRTPTLEHLPGISVLSVPFSATVPMAQEIAEQVTRDWEWREPLRVLATHVGCYDDTDAFWMRDAKDAISADRLFEIMDGSGIHVAIVGNYHQHRFWSRDDRTIIQVGALNPRNFADAGLDQYGSLILLQDDGSWARSEIPGPRFVVVKDGQFPDQRPGCQIYCRAVGEDLGATAGETFAGYEHQPEPAPDPEARAEDVPQAESPEQALADYVARMPQPQGVEAQEVLDAVMDSWRRA